ncbi:MAG: C-GCAxxG-C-C family protein [Acidobacteriota bacterium]|nr:C-GCAxxG-C-C family protein [Acidobacteriota bacterium]
MEKNGSLNISRRAFMASASGLLVGTTAFSMPSFLTHPVQECPKLSEELTPEELKMVNQSVMAKDMENYFGKGYSCAESLLIVSLRYLKQPEKMVWAACGYGGGMAHKDLCGFLTAGFMAIGFASGEVDMERKEAKKYCSRLINRYWDWWKITAPLHCRDIRKPGVSTKVCCRLGLLGAAKIEELIKT